MTDRWKEWGRTSAAILVGLVLAFALAELLCRLLPIETAYVRIPMKSDARVGFTRVPGGTASSKMVCYDISPIVFNSLGFRGPNLSQGNPLSIAVLGDSFMEAVEVPVSCSTASILQGLLRVNVLNASVASYGTTSELFVYRTFLKERRARVVLLFFFAGNDVVNNSCELSRMYGEGPPGPCGEFSHGKIEWRTSFGEPTGDAPSSSPIKAFLRQHCLSCLVAYRFLKYDVIHRLQFGDLDFLDNVFRRHPPEQWRKAWDDGWRITEEAILQLKADVESGGGKLVVVNVPSSLFIVPNWQEVFKKSKRLERVPDDFDPNLPDARLKNIGDRHRIPVLGLAPEFIQYRDRFRLTDPFFWFTCDAHWNPVGHFVAANVVARYLIEHDFLAMTAEDKEKPLRKVKANLGLSPEEILGPTAYDQIYHGGVYTGASNIDRIVPVFSADSASLR
jgi:hypothetical protein